MSSRATCGAAQPAPSTMSDAMSNKPSWFNRFVDKMGTSRFFKYLAGHVLVPFWAWWRPVPARHGGPSQAIQAGDNLQQMMNLVMPLKDKTALGRAMAAQTIAANLDAIFAGLDNVGNVHFARFVIIDNNLCMISAYDGDFTNYIRDFIAQIGGVFDGVVALIEDGDDVLPTEENIEAFIDWVRDHDLYQFPNIVTDMMQYSDPDATGDLVNEDLRLLPRAIVLQLHANRNVLLGGYRGYPALSVGEIRRDTGMGW